MGIQLFNLMTLLDFPKLIGLNGSSYDGKNSHFAQVLKIKDTSFTILAYSKVFLDRSASRNDVITRFGLYENWLRSLALFLGAWFGY